MAFCGQCGKEKKDGAAFCGHCGAQGGQSRNRPASASRDGYGCYHHPSRQAVAKCARCGKGVCEDCHDSYGAGDGNTLCFDCTEAMVEEHVAEIWAFRQKVKKERIFMIIGMVIGACFFIEAGVVGVVLGAGIGGSLWTIIKTIGSVFFKEEQGTVIAVMMFTIIFSPIITIVRFFKRFNQIKQCNEIIAHDARILQEMRDYFEYTQVMEDSAGIDLETLADEGGELFENTYARAVLSKGEQEAQAALRQGAVQIAANGEIIRSFDRRTGKAQSRAA